MDMPLLILTLCFEDPVQKEKVSKIVGNADWNTSAIENMYRLWVRLPGLLYPDTTCRCELIRATVAPDGYQKGKCALLRSCLRTLCH